MGKKIKPMAKINPKIKVDKLLTTAKRADLVWPVKSEDDSRILPVQSEQRKASLHDGYKKKRLSASHRLEV